MASAWQPHLGTNCFDVTCETQSKYVIISHSNFPVNPYLKILAHFKQTHPAPPFDNQTMNAAALALKRKYIPLCASNALSLRKCARLTGLTVQSVCRLKKRYQQSGDAIFTHGNKGRKPKNKRLDFPAVVRFYKENFCRKNELPSPFAVACEWYNKLVGKISYTSFSLAMKSAGIVSPKARIPIREKKKHLPRKERPQEGELIQIDGSRHDWLMCGRKTVIHGAIDDATHKVLSLYMCENECLLGYNEMLRQTLEKHGVPREIYSDRSSVFFVSRDKNHRVTIDEQLSGIDKGKTQWQVQCEALNIHLIAALSPEAKGRIERLWQTLQWRLPFVFRFLGITTIKAANDYLKTYVDEFNAQFAVDPQEFTPAWKPLPHNTDLDFLLACKAVKKTNSRGIFIYHGERFHLVSPRAACVEITVCLSERQGLFALQNGTRREIELVDPLCDCVSDAMPLVEKDLITRYFLTDQHEFSHRVN